MPAIQSIEEFFAYRMQQGQISSTSLLVTLFSDVVTQHGGEIWLGSLIQAIRPLGMNERLVRTAVYRLVQDDWFESRKSGRRSYYGLTRTGRSNYERAARRIYSTGKPKQEGEWTLVIPSFVEGARREALRKGLAWQGFGILAPGVYAVPSNDRQSLNELLSELEATDSAVILSARTDERDTRSALRRLVRERWNLEDLGQLYQSFTDRYGTVAEVLEKSARPGGQQSFLLRILLIHDYRRILLRDPELPATMLPRDWPGIAAQAVTRDIYRAIASPSAGWVAATLQNVKGKLPPASPGFYQRFGGLPEPSADADSARGG